ncbi:MAG: sigma-70 family RNA polymerase sigma factor [Candidatus Eisenbacteria bacterium]|nr:sigma-70 family RNA polymerase sigma factor [Candidatus Eisenbacteria bacterium]
MAYYGSAAEEDRNLEAYLQEIAQTPLLTREEEQEIGARILRGDRRARDELVQANLRFVVSVAKGYARKTGTPIMDVINQGNLGLIEAAKRFDSTRGRKFITYAVWWIRHAILKGMAEQSGAMRLPLNKAGAIRRMWRTIERLRQEGGREPTDEEIAAAMKMKVDEVEELKELSVTSLSLDAPIASDEDVDLGELVADTSDDPGLTDLHYESLGRQVDIALRHLTERESTILRHYFGLGGTEKQTLEEIGKMMSLTRERIRQIKEEALRKLRQTPGLEDLRVYLN